MVSLPSRRLRSLVRSGGNYLERGGVTGVGLTRARGAGGEWGEGGGWGGRREEGGKGRLAGRGIEGRADERRGKEEKGWGGFDPPAYALSTACLYE